MDASTRKEGGTGRNADSGAFAFAYGFGYALDAWDDAGTYSCQASNHRLAIKPSEQTVPPGTRDIIMP